jgi:hypothetical protein
LIVVLARPLFDWTFNGLYVFLSLKPPEFDWISILFYLFIVRRGYIIMSMSYKLSNSLDCVRWTDLELSPPTALFNPTRFQVSPDNPVSQSNSSSNIAA